MQYALENWPQLHEQKKREGIDEAYHYKQNVYKGLGL